MIDVIVSVTSQNTISDVRETLNSIDEQNSIILVCSNDAIKEEIQALRPLGSVLFNADEGHASNFYAAIHKNQTPNRFLTFLKAGDTLCGKDILNYIEDVFESDELLTSIRGGVRAKYNYDLYTNPGITIQGWFFKKEFIEYYTFLKMLRNDVEFALNLAYVSHAQPIGYRELEVDIVRIENHVEDIGGACTHYFNNILPNQHFFNPTLGMAFIYDILCDCYVTFIEMKNNEVSDEDYNAIVSDIDTFYRYFSALDLENLTLLLQAYNAKMNRIYNGKKHSLFMKKIPDVSFMQFLELFDKDRKED